MGLITYHINYIYIKFNPPVVPASLGIICHLGKNSPKILRINNFSPLIKGFIFINGAQSIIALNLY